MAFASRVAGLAALSVSLVAGMVNAPLFLAAFQFRLDWFREPRLILAAGATSAELLRWAAVLDLTVTTGQPPFWPSCFGGDCDHAISQSPTCP